MFETVIIMKPYAIQLPNGARDNLFSECRSEELETALADLFEQRVTTKSSLRPLSTTTRF